MSNLNPLRKCRRPTVRTWVGALLVALLFLAETFAVVHPYDSAAHANGQPCAVCLSAASLGAGAVAEPIHFDLAAATPILAIAAAIVLFCAPPTRRYARGPPTGSFTF